jgi:hypothetical protein
MLINHFIIWVVGELLYYPTFISKHHGYREEVHISVIDGRVVGGSLHCPKFISKQHGYGEEVQIDGQ